MNKSELITAISDKTNYTEESVKEILDAFVDITMHQVAKNDEVRLVGFGTFVKRRRAARNYWGFDKRLHKAKATTLPCFRAGDVFKGITRHNRGKKHENG